jgi:hypothetical protein
MLTVLFAIACVVVQADNLQTLSGQVYKNVTIISADPDRMLIVHDGGGCQVNFKDLKPDSLTSAQRTKVEEELEYFVQREKRLEKMRLETEEFEEAQRQNGLVAFEGGWVTPVQREEILQNREQNKLELERQRVALAKERAELEKEQLQTEKARYLLEGETRNTTVITYGYYTPYRTDCIYTVPHGYRNSGNKPRNNHWNNSSDYYDNVILQPKDNPYIRVDGASFYNRGPMNR